ncbi:integumentary mucin C.1-like isoform X2 [Haliotis rubra]|uniref:integumentary mucin C.1-like isoform X2 n=1 Tax=Haliotis rubra TaxID=36100 RepID=UPI001EE5F7FE|nr:integumentary mucin C.1-like isoform X2 [Haliotis rubra]
MCFICAAYLVLVTMTRAAPTGSTCCYDTNVDSLSAYCVKEGAGTTLAPPDKIFLNVTFLEETSCKRSCFLVVETWPWAKCNQSVSAGGNCRLENVNKLTCNMSKECSKLRCWVKQLIITTTSTNQTGAPQQIDVDFECKVRSQVNGACRGPVELSCSFTLSEMRICGMQCPKSIRCDFVAEFNKCTTEINDTTSATTTSDTTTSTAASTTTTRNTTTSTAASTTTTRATTTTTAASTTTTRNTTTTTAASTTTTRNTTTTTAASATTSGATVSSKTSQPTGPAKDLRWECSSELSLEDSLEVSSSRLSSYSFGVYVAPGEDIQKTEPSRLVPAHL